MMIFSIVSFQFPSPQIWHISIASRIPSICLLCHQKAIKLDLLLSINSTVIQGIRHCRFIELFHLFISAHLTMVVDFQFKFCQWKEHNSDRFWNIKARTELWNSYKDHENQNQNRNLVSYDNGNWFECVNTFMCVYDNHQLELNNCF